MDEEIKKYLDRYRKEGASDAQIRALYEAYVAHKAAQGDTGPKEENTKMSAKNLFRAFGQGALYNFGDEIGLVDKQADKEFSDAHPIASGLSKVVGGAIAPIAAVAAAPTLAGFGGAVALGGAGGMLAGAGEGEGASDRLERAGTGGAAGLVGGAAGYGVSKLIGGAAGKVLDRLNPARAVARAAKGQIDPSDLTRLRELNAMAPGTASAATATVPQAGKPISRFLHMARGIGANPEAARRAENGLVQQTKTIGEFTDKLGEQMDALNSQVPVTNKVRATMNTVRKALGGKTPDLPEENFRQVEWAPTETIHDEWGELTRPLVQRMETAQSPNPTLRDAISDFWRRGGVAAGRREGTVAQQKAREALERHGAERIVSPSLRGEPTVIPGPKDKFAPETVDLQVLRDALSRLRYMARQANKRGTEANGATLYEIKAARNALQKMIYEHEPQFAKLDTQYGKMIDQQRQVDKLLHTVQQSRSAHAGNEAFGTKSGSLGGSLPQGHMGMATAAVDAMFKNKPGAAKAVEDFILKPGGPELLQELLKRSRPAVPFTGGRVRVPERMNDFGRAWVPPATPTLRGLLDPYQQEEQNEQQ